VRARWAVVPLLVVLSSPALAQQGPAAAAGDSAAARVAILTLGPGDEVWELWGHNEVVVIDPSHRRNRSYDWGQFNFRQKNFILRFARGRMWYSMGAHKPESELEKYAYLDRSIVLQDLALTPEQLASLQEFLTWNYTEANRHFRYNYYLDNCSTRLRDAIDRVLGGQLKAQFDTLPSGHTWRWETRRILGWNLPLYVVINLALGQPVDEEMSAWQAMFLPLRVKEYLSVAQVAPGMRLVQGEQDLRQSSRYVEAAAPEATWLPLLLAGLAGGALLLWLGTASRTSRRARRWFRLLASGWSFVAGFLGLLLLGLWFLTDHLTSRQNENVLLLTPLSLGLVVLIPMALRDRAGSVGSATRLARVVAGLAGLALVIKVLPWFHQYNLEMIGLILPVHAGLSLGLTRATAQS
jgi:uncharacterized membrane protein YdcZ (DUF606 family)